MDLNPHHILKTRKLRNWTDETEPSNTSVSSRKITYFSNCKNARLLFGKNSSFSNLRNPIRFQLFFMFTSKLE